MQSPVTMASSTKIPRTRMNPYSVKRLIVTPRYGISAKAPIKATGTPTQTHNATAGRKNNPSNTIMNPIPINAESLRVTRRFLIMSARLFHTSMETPLTIGKWKIASSGVKGGYMGVTTPSWGLGSGTVVGL